MRTIQTAFEVKQFSPADESYNTKIICNNLYRAEYSFFVRWFNSEFYQTLIDDLIVVPATDAWNSSTVYVEDAYTWYCGRLWQSAIPNNEDVPGETENWTPVPKFNTECYENLYNYHLASCLAHNTFLTTIGYSTMQAGAHGVMKQGSASNAVPLSGEEFSYYLSKVKSDTQIYTKNMLIWMESQIDCNFEDLLISCGHIKRKQRVTQFRRIMFRH